MSKPRVRFGARPGFSMLELIVVLTIVGIAMGMSAGRFHDLIIQNRVSRAATSVRNDLEAAFTIAARNREPTRIAWSSSDMEFSVTNHAGTTTFRHTALGPDAYGLTAGAVTVSSSPIEVYPNGMANTSLTITFRVENMTRTVRMSRAGLVKVQ